MSSSLSRTLLEKEFMEYRRDGRIQAMALIIVLLVLLSLATGWASFNEQQQQLFKAQAGDQTVFASQGDKNPHAAGHFGRMAYKSLAPLALFDPGAAPYLGQVSWLEAHNRDPAMFRPAEDFADIRRMEDLSVSGVLRLLLPLLIFLLGYGAFAAERERGTLRQILSTGPGSASLFQAKFLAIALISLVAIGLALGVSLVMASLVSDGQNPEQLFLRGGALFLAYALYGLGFVSVALWISARSSTAKTALLILLGVWSLSTVVLPRVSASVAAQLYPTPSSQEFWSDASAAIREARPDKDSDAWRELRLQVIGEALGRSVDALEADNLQLNRPGLFLAISEKLGANTYQRLYQNLFHTYEQQMKVRRWMSLLSPTVVLGHLSSALSGTDIATHRDFTEQAEQQRLLIVSRMNADMMLNGAGQGFEYLSQSDFWATIPNFRYQPPNAWFALENSIVDFIILFFWTLFVTCLAWRTNQKHIIRGILK
jgi:ABC-2 type transport system permease protein